MGVGALRGVRNRSQGPNRVHRKTSLDTQVSRPQLSTVSMKATNPKWPEEDLFLFNEPEDPIGAPDQGIFYSRRRQFVGMWRLAENVLSLSWDTGEPPDIVRAVETEKEWRNDQTGLVLSVISLEVLPQWLAPTVLSRRYESLSIAERFNECSVCYFELFRLPVGILRLQSRRACPHYFHTECIKRLVAKNASDARAAGYPSAQECPICGARFSEIKTLPDVFKDPRAWFQLCDIDSGGTLDQEEVLGALGAVLPVARDKLAVAIEDNWEVWDPDNDGVITLTEFVEPRRGLRQYLLRNFNNIKSDSVNLRPSDIPDLDSHPMAWFDFWDGNRNGSLERSEVVRAIIKTFCLNPGGEPSFARAFDIRELAMDIWDSLGYHEFGELTFEEFNAPFGVGDQIYHNFIHGMHVTFKEKLIQLSRKSETDDVFQELDSTFLEIVICDSLLRVVAEGEGVIISSEILDDILNGIIADRLLDMALAASHRSVILGRADPSELSTLRRNIGTVAGRAFASEIVQRLTGPAQPHLHVLLGDDEMGTTYYVIMNDETTARKSKDKNEDKRFVLISTVNSTSGCQNFIAKVQISDKTCFQDLTSTISKEDSAGSVIVKTLSNKDPIVKKLNGLCTKGKLHHVDVDSDGGKAAPNTRYYGFTEDDINVDVVTNENGELQSSNVEGWPYGSFARTMYGKAMQVVLESDGRTRRLILEPVNVGLFDGWKATFPQARESILDGEALTKDQIAALFKAEREPSRTKRITRSLRRFLPISPGIEKDELGSKLLNDDADMSEDDEMVHGGGTEQPGKQLSRFGRLKRLIRRPSRPAKTRRS
ncbi:hypothetical protein FOL47_006617 [Perkinsus chesapeaki]|uniref:RING-type domain-containing protein n=1 Tax=Perkinsus chesapeaki TaxID=330153 RepID=A0A7J6LQN2_PERCH|nr:hypothetical protein FOL47_006617 [Perkinsus chesapeaki]